MWPPVNHRTGVPALCQPCPAKSLSRQETAGGEAIVLTVLGLATIAEFAARLLGWA